MYFNVNIATIIKMGMLMPKMLLQPKLFTKNPEIDGPSAIPKMLIELVTAIADNCR